MYRLEGERHWIIFFELLLKRETRKNVHPRIYCFDSKCDHLNPWGYKRNPGWLKNFWKYLLITYSKRVGLTRCQRRFFSTEFVVMFEVLKSHQIIRRIHFMPVSWKVPPQDGFLLKYTLIFLNWHFPIFVKHFARDIIFLFYLKKEIQKFSPKYLDVYILYFNLLKD